jgi:hypothetical protein
LKPSKWDGKVSDGKLDVEDNLPYTIAFRVNNVMVTMVVDLKEA